MCECLLEKIDNGPTLTGVRFVEVPLKMEAFILSGLDFTYIGSTEISHKFFKWIQSPQLSTIQKKNSKSSKARTPRKFKRSTLMPTFKNQNLKCQPSVWALTNLRLIGHVPTIKLTMYKTYDFFLILFTYFIPSQSSSGPISYKREIWPMPTQEGEFILNDFS